MTGVQLDPYGDRYAARTQGMTASAIRALFAVASRPEVVSLAGGMPFIQALPLDAVSEMVAALVRDRGPTALQYGSGQGYPELRERICDVMALEGIAGSPDDVVVTVGSQQALDLVTRIFIDPGDVILAEAPSYVGALSTFASYQASVVHVAMDEAGLVPAALDEACTRLERAGRPVKFLYTVPNFHNPAGVSLSVPRRAEVLDIAARHGLLVLEDNPYGLLGFDHEPVAALRATAEDGVLYLGSFSKTFAPGLRVGWVLAPHSVREKLVLAAEASVLCPPHFTQMVVADYLRTQPWQDQVKVYREVYRDRRDTILEALAQQLPPGSTWTKPAGGFYTWVTLPGDLDASEMLPRAIAHRVAYVPGSAFYADGSGRSALRLSYCYPEPERIREGVRRLAAVIEEEMDLRSTFAGALPTASPGTVSDAVSTPGPDVA
ncbi:MAG TPA: PLP-dependent aminotransferase family protein [Mycobacteriales bacterium]|nr:PLP-dependent aminotransferase family protein [Mycobacteriales bacterium]